MTEVVPTQADIDAWEVLGPAIFHCDITGPEALARHAATARLAALEEAAKEADRIAYEQRIKRATDGRDSGGIVAAGYVAHAIRLASRGAE